MSNQNGQLILQALQRIDEPATVTKIVTHIADTAGVHPNEVKESVQETLNGGVRYGYIQRTNRKYYAAPVDIDGLTQSAHTHINNDDDDENNSGTERRDRNSEEIDGEELDHTSVIVDRNASKRRRRRISRSKSLRRAASRRKRSRR